MVSFNTFLNVRVIVGAFNKEKALVGAFSGHLHRDLVKVCWQL